MSETVKFIMLTMFCTICALENHKQELTKLVKHANEDVSLYCGLTAKHEEYNRNITVTWWFLKICKLCYDPKMSQNEEWEQISCNGPCTLTLKLDNSNANSGFYLCKMWPYHTDSQTTLQIEITKTFQLEVVDFSLVPPPELVNDTQSIFEIPANSQVILQCKCHSVQRPTIKWFQKQKDSDEDGHDQFFHSNAENSRDYIPIPVYYFENYYQPVTSSSFGKPDIMDLSNNLYLSKLIVNNVTEKSTYVCVAINYFGFSYREFLITTIQQTDQIVDVENEEEDVSEFSMKSDKSFELFLIPVLLLFCVFFQILTIVYLLVHRRFMNERNKIVV